MNEHHHIVSYSKLIAIWLILLALTALTVAITRVKKI